MANIFIINHKTTMVKLPGFNECRKSLYTETPIEDENNQAFTMHVGVNRAGAQSTKANGKW